MSILYFPQVPSSVAQAPLAIPYPSHLHPSAELPIELWKEIFVLATQVPGGYNTSYVYVLPSLCARARVY